MASKFTWISVFKAVAAWLVDYEGRQPELVGILKEVGIDVGLDDKDETSSHEAMRATSGNQASLSPSTSASGPKRRSTKRMPCSWTSTIELQRVP